MIHSISLKQSVQRSPVGTVACRLDTLVGIYLVWGIHPVERGGGADFVSLLTDVYLLMVIFLHIYRFEHIGTSLEPSFLCY